MTGGYTCYTCGENLADITYIVNHRECPRVLRARDLTQREQNTLLYIGVRVVDHGGELLSEQMNHDDRNAMKLFVAARTLEVEDFQQITAFPDEAWDLERDCRQLRAIRRDDDGLDVGTPPSAERDASLASGVMSL